MIYKVSMSRFIAALLIVPLAYAQSAPDVASAARFQARHPVQVRSGVSKAQRSLAGLARAVHAVKVAQSPVECAAALTSVDAEWTQASRLLNAVRDELHGYTSQIVQQRRAKALHISAAWEKYARDLSDLQLSYHNFIVEARRVPKSARIAAEKFEMKLAAIVGDADPTARKNPLPHRLSGDLPSDTARVASPYQLRSRTRSSTA